MRRLADRPFRYLLAFVMIASLLGFGMAGRSGVQAQAAPPESASYVPADSLLFVTVNLDVTSTPWLQAAILTQRIDENLTPEQIFSSLASSIFGGQASQIDPELFLGGEVTLVAVDPAIGELVDEAIPVDTAVNAAPGIAADVTATEVTEGYVLVTLPPDVEAANEAMQQALRSQAQVAGISVDETTYEGIAIQSIPADEATERPGIAIAQVDGAVIAAAAASELEAVIDVRVNDGPSIADSEFIGTVLEPLPAEYLAIGALSGPVAAEATEGVDDTGISVDVIVPGGQNAFTGFTITAENDGFRFDSRATSMDGTPLAGAGEAFDAQLPERLPAETQLLVNGNNFGGTGLLDAVAVTLFTIFFGTLEGSFVPFDPVASPVATPEPTLEESAADAFQTLALLLGVNLQTDLFNLLDGEYAFGVWGVENANIGHASAAFIAQTSDPATVSSTLTTLTNFLGIGPAATGVTGAAGATPETTGDSGLIEIDLSGMDPNLSSLAIGVVDDALVIGYGEGGDVVTDATGESLAETELFGTVTGALPAERNQLIFVNLGLLQSSLGPTGGISVITGGQALAIAGFQDGDMAGMQGILSIPEAE